MIDAPSSHSVHIVQGYDSSLRTQVHVLPAKGCCSFAMRTAKYPLVYNVAQVALAPESCRSKHAFKSAKLTSFYSGLPETLLPGQEHLL